jgi:hypothetical protein
MVSKAAYRYECRSQRFPKKQASARKALRSKCPFFARRHKNTSGTIWENQEPTGKNGEYQSMFVTKPEQASLMPRFDEPILSIVVAHKAVHF